MWNHELDLSSRKFKEHEQSGNINTSCAESSHSQYAGRWSPFATMRCPELSLFFAGSWGLFRPRGFKSGGNGQLSSHHDQASHRSFQSKFRFGRLSHVLSRTSRIRRIKLCTSWATATWATTTMRRSTMPIIMWWRLIHLIPVSLKARFE